MDSISINHPLYSQVIDHYERIERSVQKHSMLPGFCSDTPGRADSIELEWNGTNYSATLTDSNGVLSKYTFSADEPGISFEKSGDEMSLNLREDNTLEIYIGNRLAAEISNGRLDIDFVMEVLEDLDYEIDDKGFTMQGMKPNEQMYSYSQSQQISMQTGFIGYLRADFGTSGNEFYSTWNEFSKALNTEKFSDNLDYVINSLRNDEGLLQS